VRQTAYTIGILRIPILALRTFERTALVIYARLTVCKHAKRSYRCEPEAEKGSLLPGRQFAQAVEPGIPDLEGLRMVGTTVRGTEKRGATVEGGAW
jgi:hypothetical protein